MAKQRRLKSGTGFLSEEFEDGSLVLIDETSGVSHVLNKTGALAYRLCLEHGRADAQTRFVDAFLLPDDEARARAGQDFDEVVEDMLGKGILCP